MPGYRNQATGTIAANAQAVTLAWREAFNGGAAVQLAGTFSGTLALQITLNGTNWVPVVVTDVSDNTTDDEMTATGIYKADVVGALQVRVIATAWTSGTANVTLVALPG